MSRPTILITGLPGAGKSTVAARVAEAFEPSMHLQVDGLRAMMVREYIAPEQADGGAKHWGRSSFAKVRPQLHWRRAFEIVALPS